MLFAFRHLFDVAQYSPAHSAKHMQQIVKDIHKKFTENRDRQGKNCFIVAVVLHGLISRKAAGKARFPYSRNCSNSVGDCRNS